jgi:hypothetical protein
MAVDRKQQTGTVGGMETISITSERKAQLEDWHGRRESAGSAY